MAGTKRRARGEDSIYYDRSRDRWTGTITAGWKPDGRRDRITVRGRTKTEVKEKLRAKHTELAAGIRTPANYAVEQCLNDWLGTLNTQAQSTLTGYRITVRHLIKLTGKIKLVELKVRDVDFALGKLAERFSTRSVRLARMILMAVYRSVRRTGETKTERSRRVFQVPDIAVEALRELVLKQAAARAKAGSAWKENNLMFCTSLSGPMYATDVRMEFK